MTKQQFIARLKSRLSNLDRQTMEDILYDYEEHFAIGMENGKSEEEICRALGLPEQIASQYRFEQAVKRAEESPRPHNLLLAIVTGVGLGFFNLIFVLGIYLALFGVMIGFFVASTAIFLAGVMILFKAIFPGLFLWMSIPFHMELLLGRLAALFSGIGVTALGLLMLIFVMKLTELMYRGTLAYVKANISIIKKAAK